MNKFNEFVRKVVKKVFVFRLFSIALRAKKSSHKKYLKIDVSKVEINNYIKYYNRTPNLENPKLFSEKILWQKLKYYNKDFTRLADKILVKDYVFERTGLEMYPKTIRTFSNYKEIDFNGLPDVFVLKTNHLSGYIYLAKKVNNKYTFKDLKYKDAPEYSEKQIKKIYKYLLKTNIYFYHFEWVYKDIKPMAFIEEFIETTNLIEYKLQMADGKLGFINNVWGRMNTTFDNYYDENLEFMDIEWDSPSKKNVSLPAEINSLIGYAEKLSQGIPLARVDFYLVDDKIYVGEMTFFYSAGYLGFKKPNSLDEIIGKKLNIDRFLNIKKDL